MTRHYADLGEGTVHYQDKGMVWFSRGRDLYRGTGGNTPFSLIGTLPEPQLWRRWLGKSRIGSRIIRGGVLNLIPLADGALAATMRGSVFVRAAGQREFKATLTRPGRSWRLEALPDGVLFAAEYFSNMARSQVEILKSLDGGLSWRPAYLFPAGTIRHIHGITYDHRREQLIVLTGDEDREAMIMLTSDQFRTTSILMQGSQAARALTILPGDDGYWLGTDTPYEQNYAQLVSLRGEIITRVPLSGSCLSATSVGDRLFFGTAVEPSAVNRDPMAKLYAYDGHSWTVLGSWRTDVWSGAGKYRAALFQMARVLLPRCRGTADALFATTIAVRGADGHLHRWKDGGDCAGS